MVRTYDGAGRGAARGPSEADMFWAAVIFGVFAAAALLVILQVYLPYRGSPQRVWANRVEATAAAARARIAAEQAEIQKAEGNADLEEAGVRARARLAAAEKVLAEVRDREALAGHVTFL